MTKSQMIGIVAKKSRMSKRATNEVIEIFLEEMTNSLIKGEKVVMPNFGTFYISKVKEKEVVPFGQVEKRQVIKAHKVVNFRPGKALKKQVW